VLYLEEAQNKQKSNASTITDLEKSNNDVRREIETIEERRQVLKSEFHQLETEKQDIQLDLEQKVKREKERIEPEIKRMLSLIQNINSEIVDNDLRVTKEDTQNKEMEHRIIEAEKKKDSLKEEADSLVVVHRKEKDEPERLEKANVNLKKSVGHVQAELDKLKSDVQKTEDAIARELKQQEGSKDTLSKKETVFEDLKKRKVRADRELKELKDKTISMTMEFNKIQEEKKEIEDEIKSFQGNKFHE